MRFINSLITSVVTLSTFASAFDASSNKNVAVYWGQNSAGNQGTLGSYCESNEADIFLLSFLIGFNDPLTLNFANACGSTSPNGVLQCDQIAADIAKCQSLGKKVLLSLGGASGAYGFTDDSQAETFALTLWNYFGEGTTDYRPFGTSVVDGFDFDIENNNSIGYAALATKLREYFATGSKPYYLSAAPQCPYPDVSVGDLLENAEIDFVFIQFYNNYCQIQGTFNWDTWLNYAENVSPNKDVKLFLGLPGAPQGAGSGYVDFSTVESTINTIGSGQYFGGVSLWDASQSEANPVNGVSFAKAIKSALESLDEPVSPPVQEPTVSSATVLEPTTSSSTTVLEPATSSSTTILEPTTSSSTTVLEPTTSSSTTILEPTTEISTVSTTSESTSTGSSSSTQLGVSTTQEVLPTDGVTVSSTATSSEPTVTPPTTLPNSFTTSSATTILEPSNPVTTTSSTTILEPTNSYTTSSSTTILEPPSPVTTEAKVYIFGAPERTTYIIRSPIKTTVTLSP